jgi:DNA repair ATPase RecN
VLRCPAIALCCHEYGFVKVICEIMSKIASDLGIVLGKILQERSRIWSAYDSARQQESELNQYTQLFQANTQPSAVKQLSKSGKVPDELAESVWRVKQEAEKIQESEKLIEQLKQQIAETNQQFFIVAGIGAFILLIIIFTLLNR